MKNLEAILEWNDGATEYEKCLLQKASEYEGIIIFGAGIGGKMTLDLLDENGLRHKVKAFSDNNTNKVGTSYYGVPVIEPHMINEYRNKTLILVSSTAFDIISDQVCEFGIAREDIYYFQPAGISAKKNEDMQFIKKYIIDFSFVYNMLQDDISRLIYSHLLNYRISKNKIWLEKMKPVVSKENEQYFDKDIIAEYIFEDIFIDAGSYRGDTLDNFFGCFPAWGGNYYCLEASEAIFAELEEHIKKRKNCDKVHPIKCAVWNEEGHLCFDSFTYGDGEGSRVSEQGTEVQCDSLDNLFRGKPVSFIKMDIEGAERNGLTGAREIIDKNVPILAICIYHKPEDFFDIPLLIEHIKPNEYEYFIRQYRYGQSETVLYAMPKSRKVNK